MKKLKPNTPAKAAVAERIRRRDRRTLLRGAVAAAVVIPLAAIGISQYNRYAAQRYDLSVLGNGTPTVVLVMDRNNREANDLRKRFDSVQGEFGDSVQFRIADLATADGALFAARYQVSTLTIVMLDADARVRNTLTGLQDSKLIAEAVGNSFPGARRGS